MVTHLEDSLSISERRDVSRSILLVHGLSSKNLSNHVTHDSHHSSTSVVKLNIELARLLLGVLDVSSEVTNSIVSIILGSRHPCKLNKSEESKDLSKSSGGDSTDSVNSGGDIGELEVVGGGEVSIENNVVIVDNGSYNSSHSNTSVLTLNSTTALEVLGLSVKPSKRIVDSERSGGSNLQFVNVEGGGDLGGGSRSKSGCRCAKEGSNSELHIDIIDKFIENVLKGNDQMFLCQLQLLAC
mmetsp:Transcript_3363/g.6292  ORF Transcript_3363/g.6292 Transcript_3363/m.6292 type:complete len:241 (-) Transcript_3363:19-741(-)